MIIKKLFGRDKKTNNLPYFLYYFDKFKEPKEEIYITELLESIFIAQKDLFLGYTKSESLFYSPEFFEELDRLKNKHYIKIYERSFGKGHRKCIEIKPSLRKEVESKIRYKDKNLLEVIKKSVELAIKNEYNRYSLLKS